MQKNLQQTEKIGIFTIQAVLIGCPAATIQSLSGVSMIFDNVNVLLPIITALCGAASGIFLAGKRQGGRESKVEQQGKDIDGIKNERAKLLNELKSVVFDGVKLAIAELRVEQAERHGGHDTAIATLTARMGAAEGDIVEIFGRLNRREQDYGRVEGERRSGREG